MDSRRFQPGYGRPQTTLVVETQGLTGHDSKRTIETYDVHKPIGIGRQRDQLVRTVAKTHPDAEIATLDEGIATFFSRTHMIVAAYSDTSRLRIEEHFDTTKAFTNLAL